MKPSLLLSALLVAVPMTVAPAATAGSDHRLDPARSFHGELCSMGSITFHPDGTASTILRGGPMYATDPSASVWLLCSVQVNGFTHDAPDAAGTKLWAIGSVVQEPTEVRFTATPRDAIIVCTETWITKPGGHWTLFFDGRTFTRDAGAACGIRPRCSLTSITNPFGEVESMVGQINAGPLAATAPGASIQLTCTVQVGGANWSHAGTDSDFVTSTMSTQVTSIPPTEDDQLPIVSYIAPENVPVFICTEAIINGTSWYWDGTLPPGGNIGIEGVPGWSTSSNVPCNEAFGQEIFPGPFQPVLDILLPLLDQVLLIVDGILETIDGVTQPIEEAIDTLICTTLGGLAPGVPGLLGVTSEGDIYVLGEYFWDCPTYGNGPTDFRFLDTYPTTVTINNRTVTAPPNCNTTTSGGTTTVTCAAAVPSTCNQVEVWASGGSTGTADCGNNALVAGPVTNSYASAVGEVSWPFRCTASGFGSVTCQAWSYIGS